MPEQLVWGCGFLQAADTASVNCCPAALIPSLCCSDSSAASVGLPLVEILYSEAVYDLRYLSLQHCFYISPWLSSTGSDKDRKSMRTVYVLMLQMQTLVSRCRRLMLVTFYEKLICEQWDWGERMLYPRSCFFFSFFLGNSGYSEQHIMHRNGRWNKFLYTQKEARLKEAAPNDCSFFFFFVPPRFVPEKHKPFLHSDITWCHYPSHSLQETCVYYAAPQYFPFQLCSFCPRGFQHVLRWYSCEIHRW